MRTRNGGTLRATTDIDAMTEHSDTNSASMVFDSRKAQHVTHARDQPASNSSLKNCRPPLDKHRIMKARHASSLLNLIKHTIPYLAIELLMPGGSVVALLVWLYRSKAKVPTAHLDPIEALRHD
jgi:hypothetical protein